jgi:hypothetical protein
MHARVLVPTPDDLFPDSLTETVWKVVSSCIPGIISVPYERALLSLIH